MRARQTPQLGRRIGKLFGIEVRVHISVTITFLLITMSMIRILSDWYPDWPLWQSTLLAALSGLIFFASLVCHEFAHCFVARRFGIGVKQITVFLFGGAAEIEGEPTRPRDEFFIAAAGPAASLLLAFTFNVLANMMSPTGSISFQPDGSVIPTDVPGIAMIFMWLALVNFMLAVFNLLPGFPMDGGRLFRAALWWHSNDYVKATKQAARVGQGIGLVFVFLGFLQVLNGAIVNGIWTLCIGWFIHFLAAANSRQVMRQVALDGVSVAELMRTRFDKVPANTTTTDFVNEYLLRSQQQLWPIEDIDNDPGYVLADDFLGREIQQSDQLLNDINALTSENSLTENTSAVKALEKLSSQTTPIPVVSADGRIVGLLAHTDIVRWLTLHGE